MSMVIVGGGLAGAKAAEELRERGYDGEVTLLGAEPHLPYERPPLSKSVLLGEKEPDSTQRARRRLVRRPRRRRADVGRR